MSCHGAAEPSIPRARRPLARQDAFECLAEVGVAQRVQKGVDRRIQIAEPVRCKNEGGIKKDQFQCILTIYFLFNHEDRCTNKFKPSVFRFRWFQVKTSIGDRAFAYFES